MKKLLILGVNGFIGHHLLQRVMNDTDWSVTGVDLADDRVQKYIKNPRFTFYKIDMVKRMDMIEQLVKKSDVVLPLVAIATPGFYISDPLRVFELDFEANLPIVRMCVKYKKRIIWPSTSEVYGMSTDKEFDPETSSLVLGPIGKIRWIYSNAKQLMDRVIWAYGRDRGLDYTLIRPFNWIGIGLDDFTKPSASGSRVITQFLGNILRGEDLRLVNGGEQRRSFTHVDDGMNALLKIIENKGGVATGKIYNIGNPKNNHSIKELAEMVLKLAHEYPYFNEHAPKVKIVSITEKDHYGDGYQDVPNRTPKITGTMTDLEWEPRVTMEDALRKTFDAYIQHLEAARQTIYEG